MTAAPAEAATQKKKDQTVELRVGSFNVKSVHHDPKARGAHLPWNQRRAAVIADILGERADVVGLQETHQSYNYAPRLLDGRNQYLDLRNGLNKAGGSYELTNDVPQNCLREWTISKCVYTDRGASRNLRILYDTRTLEAVRTGSHEYAVQSGGLNDTRYMTWAIFRHRLSGEQFFFVNTHLINNFPDKQKAQWEELITEIERRKGDLPVVVVGDFQRSRTKYPSNQMMVKMKKHGYGEVVGQKPNSLFLTKKPRAEKRVNAWMNTVNGFDRNIKNWSFNTDRKRKLGNYADWIFASNHLRVSEWKVVVDRKKLQLNGVVPSDHNMVRATLHLPASSGSY
ncbi:endonuclease/exonuclease/phosphatase family protein [Microbacterium sp.]|uniref:endonuclease/exonuclease/phosphatase family protein n=1 Tax=Microbacterium sp. TaxID=51671 RepID=UPI003735906C